MQCVLCFWVLLKVQAKLFSKKFFCFMREAELRINPPTVGELNGFQSNDQKRCTTITD
jgi:hypothetical protein